MTAHQHAASVMAAWIAAGVKPFDDVSWMTEANAQQIVGSISEAIKTVVKLVREECATRVLAAKMSNTCACDECTRLNELAAAIRTGYRYV